jgi:transcriptional regulator with XRE-family HTH domain
VPNRKLIDSAAAGRRIRQRREQLGMTQTELAKAIGLKDPTTSKITKSTAGSRA